MNRYGWRVAVLAALVCVYGAGGAGVARAQPTPEQRREAGAHFDRAIEFFNEGRFDASLAEFEAAYRIAPAPSVLYNLGRVHAELGHAVEATSAFERYLAEDRAVPPARRAEVEAALVRQRARIGFLEVRANVENAIVSIDGVDVARTPLPEPLRVNAGRRTLGVRAAGYESVQQAVQIAGGANAPVVVELTEARERRGILRVTSRIRDLVVVVNEETVGRTPLESTIPVASGRVVITAERAGYRPVRREIDVQDGAEIEIELEPEPEAQPHPDHVGTLIMRLPDAPVIARIDGEVMDVRTEVRLPAGTHDVELDVAEREPWRGTVTVPGGGEAEVTPPLQWRPDARAERLEDAASTRRLGRWISIGGAVLLAGGAVTFVLMDGAMNDSRADLDAANAGVERCSDPMEDWVTCGGPRYEEQQRAAQSDFDTQNTFRTVGMIVGGVGVAALAVGLWFWISPPSESSIDDEAHAAMPRLRLGVGLASVGATLSF